MGIYHPVLSIAPKCCAKKWFHRSCLMRYALSAGYYVKCMWCQKKEFRDQIRLDGIFVPDRDASWEKEPNAYSDLHRPHRKCVAEDCLCPKGKEYNNSSSRLWAIILCCMCGAYPLHVGCYQSSTGMVSSDFVCNDCQLIRTYISLNAAPCDMNNANKTQDLNLAEDNVELSQLDKSLYLVKTLNYDDFQTYHDNRSTNSTKESLKCGIDSQNSVAKILHDTVCNNENFDIANSISSNSSQKINLKQYLDGFIQTDKQNAKVHGYYIEHANNWVEFCFEKETLRGTIIGTLISPKSIKYKYSIDEIIPKIIKLYGKTDSSSDSETDVECEEIFISVLKDELKKNGISTENLRKQKIRNKVKVRKHTKKYFLQSQKRENLKAIVTANSLKNDKLDEKFDLDKIKIEKLLFFETELHSDSSPTESEEELFQKILENEIKKEQLCINNQKEQVRRISF
ncbi:uncharacterized protein LOC129611385 isoform X2 [Condylostylus longicornis]|nr:uncharacterized protein LOC129611385 isoform X2 [Condylostylus longicornis]XP_055380495.1 uncharacterized protein LOC129611385 isoform X2 [Condylostylus longicornis]